MDRNGIQRQKNTLYWKSLKWMLFLTLERILTTSRNVSLKNSCNEYFYRCHCYIFCINPSVPSNNVQVFLVYPHTFSIYMQNWNCSALMQETEAQAFSGKLWQWHSQMARAFKYKFSDFNLSNTASKRNKHKNISISKIFLSINTYNIMEIFLLHVT